MSFIAIDAKADVVNSKKGKLTPAQHAQLNAFCLANKTGIFNCLGKCEYVAPISIMSGVATITFSEGYVVICGRLVHCEAGTTFNLTLPSGSTTETGHIVLRYNLSSFGESEFEIDNITGTPVRQDLNENPMDGIYEFVLYDYTATSSNLTLTRNFDYLKSVEQRLEELGFKEGSVAGLGNVTLKKLGKFAIIRSNDLKITVHDVDNEGYFTFYLRTTDGIELKSAETFETHIPKNYGLGNDVILVKFTKSSSEVKLHIGDGDVYISPFSIGIEIE